MPKQTKTPATDDKPERGREFKLRLNPLQLAVVDKALKSGFYGRHRHETIARLFDLKLIQYAKENADNA